MANRCVASGRGALETFALARDGHLSAVCQFCYLTNAVTTLIPLVPLNENEKFAVIRARVDVYFLKERSRDGAEGQSEGQGQR